MPKFSIHDPYVPQEGVETPNEQSDFEIDSDVSDEEAQELLKELKTLEPSTVQRDLADATLYLQRIAWERWSK